MVEIVVTEVKLCGRDCCDACDRQIVSVHFV